MKTLMIFLTNKMYELQIYKALKFIFKAIIILFFIYSISNIIGYLGLKFLPQSVLVFLQINTTVKIIAGIQLVTAVIGFIFILLVLFLILYGIYHVIFSTKKEINKFKEFIKDNWLYAKILSGEEERFILIKERKVRSLSHPLIVKKYSNSDYFLMGVDFNEEVDSSAHKNFSYETDISFSNLSTIKRDLLCMFTKEEVESIHKFYPDFIRIRAERKFMEEAGIFYQKTIKGR